MAFPQHYLLSGEFHYFRVPKADWRDRLLKVKDIGMRAVSIYVPWNWHEPQPGGLDFVGRTRPERDLIGALDCIAKVGLGCIFRPGPFITNEWRGGGLPDWLWERDREILSLDASGQISGRDRLYPAVTYAHPVYRAACQKWYEEVFQEVRGYLSSQGGPIFHVQLDDEPSYWHLLSDPLQADYNPCLIAHTNGPSQYAMWLYQRYGSLGKLNDAHHTGYQSLEQIEPPRREMSRRDEYMCCQDWLDFKLSTIDEYTRFLYEIVRNGGVQETVSMLYPYLLPMQAAKYADFLRQHNLPIELTNEVYLSLISASSCSEQKVGHVVFAYEYYHMWRGSELGPAVTMELQGSNSSYITPEAMELLYDITIARGVKGFNIFMMVGGETPRGYENLMGQEYDASAPISLSGEERLHAGVLRRLTRIIRTCEKEILAAEPLRDIWWGCYAPYETAALVGGEGAMADAGFASKWLINSGEHGISELTNLQALLSLSSISCGCLDLERTDNLDPAKIKQLWVFSLEYMAQTVQERLAGYVQNGGHLVILPCLPRLDERMSPCEILMNLIFRGNERPEFVGVLPGSPRLFTQVYGMDGESLVAPGRPTTFKPAPADKVLAQVGGSGLPCAIERTIGSGKVTLLGFPLVYMHTASQRQKDFVVGIVERSIGKRCAWTSNPQLVALELAGQQGSFVCVVNPVDLPAETSVHYTLPVEGITARFPLALDHFHMARQGARLLPVSLYLNNELKLRHSTLELIGMNASAGNIELRFAAQPGGLAEVALEGKLKEIRIQGGDIKSMTQIEPNLTVIGLAANHPEISLQFRPA